MFKIWNINDIRALLPARSIKLSVDDDTPFGIALIWVHYLYTVILVPQFYAVA